MKIGLINASEKGKKGHTEFLVKSIADFLDGYTTTEIFLETKRNLKNECFEANDCDALVIVTPIHFGGLPSSLLQFMSEMEYRYHGEKMPIGLIVHGGFYENRQGKLCMEIFRNWCNKLGMQYIMGIYCGGSEVFALENRKDKEKYLRPFTGPFAVMTMGIRGKTRKEDQYLYVPMSQLRYKANMEAKWKKEIRENGLSPKDLEAKPTE